MYEQNEIQQVELSLEEAKKLVEFGEAIERLNQNRDFKTVILEGYMGEEAKRLVFLTGEYNLTPEAREQVHQNIHGIAALRNYLVARTQIGEIAKKEVQDFSETLEEIREAAE